MTGFDIRFIIVIRITDIIAHEMIFHYFDCSLGGTLNSIKILSIKNQHIKSNQIHIMSKRPVYSTLTFIFKVSFKICNNPEGSIDGRFDTSYRGVARPRQTYPPGLSIIDALAWRSISEEEWLEDKFEPDIIRYTSFIQILTKLSKASDSNSSNEILFVVTFVTRTQEHTSHYFRTV